MAERISLVEQYDNKDMIVQMKKCLDRTADAVSVSTEASTNANAASTQAQTAATTVATYGARLQAVEDESAGNRSSIQNIDGEITDIYNDLTNVVRKVGDPEQIVYNGLELRGTNRTPDTTVGQLNDLIVNANRLIQEIDTKLNAYEHMLRTSGDQNLTGDKINTDGHFTEYGARTQGFIAKSRWVNSQQTSYNNAMPGFIFMSNDNVELGRIEFLSNLGVFMIRAEVMNHDGTHKTVELIRGDN